MTTTDDILSAARKRLDAISAERAVLDAEEAKLRRMIAAADGPEPAQPFVWPSSITVAPAGCTCPQRLYVGDWPYCPAHNPVPTTAITVLATGIS